MRELFHVIERAAVLCGSEVIDVGDLPESLRARRARPAPPVADDDDLSLHGAVARVEKQLILRALERAKGNRSAAARLLGIGRPQLYAKLEEHGLGGPARRRYGMILRAERDAETRARRGSARNGSCARRGSRAFARWHAFCWSSRFAVPGCVSGGECGR